MAPLRVGGQVVVRGGDALQTPAFALQASAGVERQKLHLLARQATSRLVEHRPRQDDFQAGMRTRQRSQGVAIEVVGVHMAGGNKRGARQSPGLDAARGQAHVRFVGAGIFLRQGIRQVGIEEEDTPGMTDQKAALPEPPDMQARVAHTAVGGHVGQQGLIALFGFDHGVSRPAMQAVR